MKRLLFATAVIGVLGLGSGCINKKGTTPDVFAPSIANVEYQHSYGDAVHVLQSENEFVICDKCQEKSNLERLPKPLVALSSGDLTKAPHFGHSMHQTRYSNMPAEPS